MKYSKVIQLSLLLIPILFFSTGGNLFAVPSEKAHTFKKKEGFVNLGMISYFPDYKLSKTHITFGIKNNTSRTIQSLFPWIYLLSKEDEENKAPKFVLINNPHKGGVVVGGALHQPGSVVRWRFPLTTKNSTLNQSGEYSIRINPKGIYFSKVEQARPKKKSAGIDQKNDTNQ